LKVEHDQLFAVFQLIVPNENFGVNLASSGFWGVNFKLDDVEIFGVILRVLQLQTNFRGFDHYNTWLV